MTRRHCFALDLKDDPDLIAEYERHHERIWPEIDRSIRASGILGMEIGRPDRSEGAGVGGADVDVSASAPMGRARREVGADEADLRARLVSTR
jgi:hypothetical protein